MGEDSKSSQPEEAKTEIIHDHPVFKKVEEGDMETIQNFFEVEGLSIEILDQHGMTPLMHASWKGSVEVAKYLIKQGNYIKTSIGFSCSRGVYSDMLISRC